MKRKVITIEVTAEEVDALEDIFFVQLSEERRKKLNDAKLSLWKKIATAFDSEVKEYKGFRLPPGKVLGIRDLEAEG